MSYSLKSFSCHNLPDLRVSRFTMKKSQFVYRIHNLSDNRVHNVSERFVLTWLKAECGETNPNDKLATFKRDAFTMGHRQVETGVVGGGSYLIITFEGVQS